MRHLLILIICATFFSCDSQNEINLYQRKIESLESKLDSLTNVIARMQADSIATAKIPASKKKGKAKNAITKSAAFTNRVVVPKRGVTSQSIESYDGYCHGITRKGYRCSRRVSSGLYCWQHGG